MNTLHRFSSDSNHSSVPAYRKWYFGAGGSPGRQGMRAAPEPDPLPFEEIHEHAEITVGPPSTPADGYSAHGTFTIPEGADGKKLYGTCSLFLGVDDWGSLEVKDSGGKVVAQVDLKENPQTAGAQGGTATTRESAGRSSPPAPTPGKSARPTSTTIRPAATPPSATTASTWFRRSRGAGRSPNRVPAKETRATKAAERRPPLPGRVLAGREWKAASWETTARRGAA